MAEGALDPAAYIFEGFWTDWTRGRTLGLTWTLCPSHATLLTNSLALFVTLAGGQLWTIIRFSLHQLRASRRPRQYSERFLQQQVILRNASTDLHTMRLMAQVGWASRKATGGQFTYPFLIVLLALIHYTVFVAAGTLSNNIINTGSESTFSTKRLNVSSSVLSRSPHCGVWSPEYLNLTDFESSGVSVQSLESLQVSQAAITKIDRSVQLSLEYVRECYVPDSRYYMSSKCDTFKRPKLRFEEAEYTGACPFGEGSCHDNQNIIVFDSQPVDSHHDLGLNTPPSDRLVYQRRTVCAVLNDTERVNNSAISTSLSTSYAFYGPSYLQGTDWTYSWSNFSSLYTEFTPQVTIPYHVNVQIAYGASPKGDFLSTFEPLPELKPDSSDLVLFFLGYTGRYFEPIDDPWFSAHQLHVKDVPAAFARRQWGRDRPISTLGCLEQHMFCTANGTCTPFLGWGQVQEVDFFNGVLNTRQRTAFDRMIRAADQSSISQVARSLGGNSPPLLAIDQCATGSTVLSLKLPDDQWRKELRHWHAVAMAQLQRVIAQWGTGQVVSGPNQLVPPSENGDIWFCNNMLVPSTVYQSFSVVWLVALIAFGTLIIIISWTVEGIADWVQLRATSSSALRKIWDSYHMLRLTAFMMRNSWGPLPPPKDGVALSQTPNPQQYDLPPTVRIVTPIQQPYSQSFGTSGEYNDYSKHSNHQTVGYDDWTPRTWSELPLQPRRDSWVEMSLNGFDFGLEESQEGSISSPSGKRESNQTPTLPSPPAPAAMNLTISNLREHALARARRHP